MKLVHWPLIQVGCYIWYSKEGAGRGAAARPGPSLLYQMQQHTHQRAVYQPRIIRYSTITAFGV